MTKYDIETEYSLRGSEFVGTVVSTKMQKSATVRWGYAEEVPKYERKERRNTKITSHVPDELEVNEGDQVRVVETRPISKTKSSMIVEVIEEQHEIIEDDSEVSEEEESDEE
ncbi:MAG: 30S ribosomal protein S17 [Candidatus Nanohaloarchaea archaeon]